MKMLVLIAALADAVPGLSCSRPSEEATPPAAAPPETTPPAPSTTKSDPGTKQAWIYFTKNHNKGMGSPYNTDCVGIVSTERIGARAGKKATTSPPAPAVPGTKIIWHIKVDDGSVASRRVLREDRLANASDTVREPRRANEPQRR